MIIKKDRDVEEIQVEMEGASDVLKKILIGLKDNSEEIFMRLFTINPGGHTPLHSHSHPHIVKIMEGKGLIVDEEGTEHEVKEGMSAFIPGGEEHQFKNPNNKFFSFLCIIPNPEKWSIK